MCAGNCSFEPTDSTDGSNSTDEKDFTILHVNPLILHLKQSQSTLVA